MSGRSLFQVSLELPDGADPANVAQAILGALTFLPPSYRVANPQRGRASLLYAVNPDTISIAYMGVEHGPTP